MKHEMWVKGTRLWCVLVEYVKYNYNARFHDPRNHRYRERHFTILLDINSMSRTITNPSFHRYRERHFSILVDVKY